MLWLGVVSVISVQECLLLKGYVYKKVNVDKENKVTKVL